MSEIYLFDKFVKRTPKPVEFTVEELDKAGHEEVVPIDTKRIYFQETESKNGNIIYKTRIEYNRCMMGIENMDYCFGGSKFGTLWVSLNGTFIKIPRIKYSDDTNENIKVVRKIIKAEHKKCKWIYQIDYWVGAPEGGMLYRPMYKPTERSKNIKWEDDSDIDV